VKPQALVARGSVRAPIIILCPETKLRYMLSIGWRIVIRDSDMPAPVREIPDDAGAKKPDDAD
jgi:hypothetical protein